MSNPCCVLAVIFCGFISYLICPEAINIPELLLSCCSWFYRNYCTVPNIIKKCMPWDHWDIGKKVYLSFHFFSECTQAGILKLSSSRTLPFWWDDVSDINTLEALAVQAYNQVIQSYKNGLVYSSVATCMN